MIIFDVIIVNTDRHFGNFGLLVDNKTNKIVKPAPIFDNGLSLFYDAMDDDLERVDEFAQTKGMKNAGDFITFASSVITTREKKRIKKLINFKDSEAEAVDSTYASRIFGVGVFTPE